MANIYYLEGHELLTPSIRHSMDGETDFLSHKMRITSKGIDFIRDDGGLGAVLNVVNIKLHNDTINRLEEIIRA